MLLIEHQPTEERTVPNRVEALMNMNHKVSLLDATSSAGDPDRGAVLAISSRRILQGPTGHHQRRDRSRPSGSDLKDSALPHRLESH